MLKNLYLPEIYKLCNSDTIIVYVYYAQTIIPRLYILDDYYNYAFDHFLG